MTAYVDITDYFGTKYKSLQSNHFSSQFLGYQWSCAVKSSLERFMLCYK